MRRLAFYLLPALIWMGARAVAADLDAVKARGELRVLMTPLPLTEGLPRGVTARQREEALAKGFAESLGARLKIVYVNAFEGLTSELLADKGDLIAANMTITAERKRKIAFTSPISGVYERLVTASENATAKDLSALHGQTMVLCPGTVYWATAEKLKKSYPSLRLQAAPESMDPEEVLRRVGSGEYPFSIVDSNYLDSYNEYRDDVKTLYAFTERRSIGWGMAKTSVKLLAAANYYLNRYLAGPGATGKGDLPIIRKRGFLRVLTTDNPTNYFIHRGGQLMGFEFELARAFAKEQGLVLSVVAPPRHEDIIPWLLAGKGDLVAAAVTISPERQKDPSIVFGPPYNDFREVVVNRRNAKPVRSRDDLKGRTFHVRRGSSYWETLSKLKAEGASFNLSAAPPDMETYEIIENVANDVYDLTLADAPIAQAELNAGVPNIGIAIPLSDPKRYGWVLRSEDKDLKAEVDAFFKKHYRGLFYNTLYNRYFKESATPKGFDRQAGAEGDSATLSPYDDLARIYAEKHRFSWCLIIAQMFQESRFDPNARSDYGAIGLMQVLPTTGADLGVTDLYKPDNNVRVGVKYMDWLRGRVADDVQGRERILFALAAYNAGFGHVLDARRLAKELKLDPDIWFNNVEEAMRRLSQRQYASRSRYGYCRSFEVIAYVREIAARYQAYAQRTKDIKGPAEIVAVATAPPASTTVDTPAKFEEKTKAKSSKALSSPTANKRPAPRKTGAKTTWKPLKSGTYYPKPILPEKKSYVR